MQDLTQADLRSLENCYITPDLARAAGFRRVDDLEGRERVGRANGAGDFSGILMPVRLTLSGGTTGERLRLDHPPMGSNGKPEHKYLSPPGQRNHVYAPLADPAWLADTTLPVLWVEGEKKYLACHRAAMEAGSNGRPLWLTLAVSGVWNWRGQIGIVTNSNGHRVPQKGVIPDLDLIAWKERKTTICYDADALTKNEVRWARWKFARELESRHAQVYFTDLPGSPGVNGPDDYLAVFGLDAFLEILARAMRRDWREELAHTDKGKILPTLDNALTALELAPEFHGVLGHNEFSLEIELRLAPPWGGPPRVWSEPDETHMTRWFERNGIRVSDRHVHAAVVTSSQEHPFHPVRDYLDSLKWDGIPRLDDWPIMYLGADPSDYTRAVGSRWMISGVARAYEPGVKADCALILEGLQGKGKSTAFEILGGPFYSDDIAELGTKDSSLAAAGVWIVELAELEAMGRAEVSRVKAFLSRRVDRFRKPYERNITSHARGCVFGGSVNLSNRYLKDETGGRRFWPLRCGDRFYLDTLRRDRDQLWAEAVWRYRKKHVWWLESDALIESAAEEQEERYLTDPWEDPIEHWLTGQVEVTVAEVLAGAIKKDAGQWTRADEIRVGFILSRVGWEVDRRAPRSLGRRRIYRQKPGP